MMATVESKSPARALRRLVGAAVASVLLRGSFSASKCKTEARMATARMKLLRNRREAQARQMRRDIAALLRDRQEDTARIRVEHVIREQNIMAANDIIELFCELIVTRLPIIAKQKECPADLKEGICSLIFAAPRCSELPELSRMCDLFEKKYGKDFVSAAVDLRPNAGVNNLLIEKLSVKKPSGQTKLKVLKEIAKEHQIDWDTTETEQELLKPPEELIQGPSTFVEASKMPVKTTLQAHVVQPIPANFSSVYADEYDNGGNMQFKDAASAARAAAESAGRAASAAKAAADLANKNTHRFDKVEDCKPSDHEFTNSSKRQSMSNSSRSSRKEDVVAFDELKPYGGKTSSTGSFSGSNRVEDKDTDPVDLGTRKIHKRNSRAARKVHSEIKFDDSEGLNSETEDESDVEIRSVERPPPRREPYARTHRSEEKELDHDLGTRKIHKRNSPAARKVHSEIKFDDSEGLNSETEDESDVEIRSVERPPPRREPYTRTHHSEEKELDHDFPDLPKANLGSRVHPNMPLDYETLTARFEALKSGKLP